MKCQICNESFEKTNSFNQHMSWNHGTNHLNQKYDMEIIAKEFLKNKEKFEASDYCQICGVPSEYTVCVLLDNDCNYAGSCADHQILVRESLRF
ncbi:Zinc finger C2H2 type domain signature protein [Marine Group I thaumarchaeote SCGC AAA799-B03]|uniref:Zinc finger C2H2 type domain signature protein n=1 Tax=Marine Group I thaumarchaeote SCGC AAA799-B03 TaxID=1502289 RepID=A0A087S6K6_9ARCH|nr:Zinc finger C2H2 type domain signature protein [Marine Group I thaumarchaeote SCGC AAA799-B03]